MSGKKGGGSAHVPYEAPNTLYSKQQVKVLDVISEGPIEGLLNGNDHPFKSIYFNDTPVQAANDEFNFFGFNLAMTTGERDQTYLPGFDVVEKTNQVNADVKQDTPITRAVTDSNVSSIRVTVGAKGLLLVKDNGDRVGTSVDLQVSLLKNGVIYTSKHVSIQGKGTEAYYQDTSFDDLPAVPFDIQVRRLTADSKSDKLQNGTVFPSFVESIDAKISYKHLAVAGYKFDAQQFGSSLPRINTLLKLQIVDVPSNYDPINRTYTGVWDGSFKKAWTDNPAWIIYHFARNKRFGGGLDPRYINRAALYRVSQFCDVMVDNGRGGKEPRVTFNAFYTNEKKFAERLQDMASAIFGLAFWDGRYLTFTLDSDDDPIHVYTNANVKDGVFTYQGISHNAVITDVQVQYHDKNDAYRQKYEVVEDLELLRRYPRNTKKIVAEGCTSQSQALRLGRYILEKSKLQETVNFSVGREGLRHKPHDVIQIADNHAAGANIGGRILDIKGNTITLDRPVEKAKSAIFSYAGIKDGKIARIEVEVLEQISDTVLVLKEITPDLKKFTVWNLARTDVKPKYYRALGITDNGEGVYSIKAIEHEVGLQDRIAQGIKFEDSPNSIWTSYPEITNGTVGNNGDDVIITWDNINADTTALTYTVKLYQDGVLYRTYPDLKEPILKFDNLPSGKYVAEIQARNSRGQLSNILKQYFDLDYTITALTTKSELFSVKIGWKLPTIVNTSVSTEIWRAEKNNINDARLLVTLPYPQSEYIDPNMSVGEKYYYWARIIDKNDTTGEFTRSMFGEPKTDPSDILEILDGKISEKQISKDLQDQFDKNIDDAIKESNIEINESIGKLELDNEKLNINIEKLEVDDVLKDISLMNEGYTRRSQDAVLEVNVADAFAQIKETNTVIVDKTNALAQKDTQLEASIGENKSEINQIKVTQVDDQKSVAILKDEVKAKFDKNEADAVLSIISLATESETRSQQDLKLSANVGSALSEIEETKTTIAKDKLAQAEINTRIESKADNNAAQIHSISQTQATDKESLTQQINSAKSEIGENRAEIEQVKNTVVNNEKSQAIFKEEVNTKFNENEADAILSLISLSTESVTRSQQDLMLSANVADAHTEIEETKGVIAEDKSAQAEINQRIESKVDNNSAQIRSISQTQTTDKESLTQEINSAKSEWRSANEVKYLTSSDVGKTPREYADLYGRTTVVEFGGRAHFGLDSGTYHTVTTTISYLTGLDKGRVTQRAVSNDFAVTVRERKSASDDTWSPWVEIEDVAGAQRKADEAQREAVRISKSSIDSLAQTQASDKQALTEQINRANSSIDGHSASIAEIRTTQADISGKVASMWTLKVDANGAIGGIMLGSDGKESQFKVAADSFIVSTGNQEKNLFVIQNINGQDVASLNVNDFIINGTLDAKKIQADSFEGVKITGVEINAGKFYGGSIAIGGTAKNPNFNVDENGSLYAKSGRFEGTVYAEKIEGDVLKNYISENNSVTIEPANYDRNYIVLGVGSASKVESYSQRVNNYKVEATITNDYTGAVRRFRSTTLYYTQTAGISGSIVHVYNSTGHLIGYTGIIKAKEGLKLTVGGEFEGRMSLLLSRV